VDVIRFYQDFHIEYGDGGSGEKHCRPGWANIPCPFCTGNPGMHLGYSLDDNYFRCWRCGWKPSWLVISQLLGISRSRAEEIIQKYRKSHRRVKEKDTPVVLSKEFTLPRNMPLNYPARRYLMSRGFDPDVLERVWDVRVSAPVSQLDNINFKNRIIIPIYWKGGIVSFQTRDYTGKSKVKYISCPENREIIHHKNIIYGFSECWGDIGICVEGVFDVWRMGTRSFATFGIELKRSQIRLISNTFRKVYILFDPDTEAKKRAKKLSAELKFRGVDSEKILLDSDPADLSQKEADILISKLLK